MRPFSFLVLTLGLSLTGCVTTTLQEALTAKSREAVASSCEGAEPGQCYVRNAPVKLLAQPVRLASRRAIFFPTAEPLVFVTRSGEPWIAPERTLTDGASIPPIFVPLVGNPDTPEFAVAAALHDAYCGIGNEQGDAWHAATWQRVHIMFHDALISGGTPDLKAKVMFAAVWLGGPRWDDPFRSLDGIAADKMQKVLADAIRYIDRTQPDLPELVLYLERRERELLAEDRQARRRDRADVRIATANDPAAGGP